MNIKLLLSALILATGMTGLAGCATYGHEQTGREVISDSTITTEVKAALLAENDVNSFDIGVETYQRIVQLSGFVDSAWQIEKAGEVAGQIAGVKTVRNNLIHKSR